MNWRWPAMTSDICISRAFSLINEALIELVLLTQYPSNDSKIIQ